MNVGESQPGFIDSNIWLDLSSFYIAEKEFFDPQTA
jgi:hypothetical protein